MIQLTQLAAQEVRRLQNSRALPQSYLRLGVMAGGCQGFYYTLDLETSPQAADIVYESQGIRILVAAESKEQLQELKLDYAQDLMGGGFRFQNPHASGTCACGLSFAKAN